MDALVVRSGALQLGIATSTKDQPFRPTLDHSGWTRYREMRASFPFPCLIALRQNLGPASLCAVERPDPDGEAYRFIVDWAEGPGAAYAPQTEYLLEGFMLVRDLSRSGRLRWRTVARRVYRYEVRGGVRSPYLYAAEPTDQHKYPLSYSKICSLSTVPGCVLSYPAL